MRNVSNAISLTLKDFQIDETLTPGKLFRDVTPIANGNGFCSAYLRNIGKGRALLLKPLPGVLFIKTQGIRKKGLGTSALSITNFINQKVYSLRLAEYGQYNCKIGKFSAIADENHVLLSHYVKSSPETSVTLNKREHNLNHLIFDDAGLENMRDKLGVHFPSHLLNWSSDVRARHPFHTYKTGGCLKAFTRSLSIQTLSHSNSIEYLRFKIGELFCLINQQAEDSWHSKKTFSAYRRRQIDAAKSIIDGSDEKIISTLQLANIVGLNRGELSEGFKALFGLTLSDYAKQKRLLKAKKLLKEDFLSIKDIARICGYKDASNFSRAYKNYFGASPKNYRAL